MYPDNPEKNLENFYFQEIIFLDIVKVKIFFRFFTGRSPKSIFSSRWPKIVLLSHFPVLCYC